jgi:hypothetical protein
MKALRVAAVMAGLVAATCASASGSTPAHVRVSTGPGPGFRSEPGWRLLQNGLEHPPLLSMAAAANVPLAKGDLEPGSPVPSHTVGSLPRAGVVIWVQFAPRRSGARTNKYFPPTRLPLRLSDSLLLDGTPEGFVCPRACAIRTLEASASGYNVAVWIFFGTRHPQVAARSAADRELARITIPGCPESPRALSRGDLTSAKRAALIWLRANYFERATSDLKGARATARRLSHVDRDSRFVTAAALCGTRADRIAAVTVELSGVDRKNDGSSLLYFLARTARGWVVWRQG